MLSWTDFDAVSYPAYMIVRLRLVDGESQREHPVPIRWSSRFETDGLSKLIETTLDVKDPILQIGDDLTCEEIILGHCMDLAEGKTSIQLGIQDFVSEDSSTLELRLTVGPCATCAVRSSL